MAKEQDMEERDNNHLNQLINLAREYRPDTSRAEFGFETRLMASLAQLKSGELEDAGAFLSVFTAWIWRSVAGLAPVVILAVVACVFWFGYSLPADAHTFVDHVTEYLPYKPF